MVARSTKSPIALGRCSSWPPAGKFDAGIQGHAGWLAGAAVGRPTVTSAPAVQVAGLRKKFGHVVAVEDVSFTAAYGRITGFLGPNGAGKTTTLQMLLGLIRPDAGTAAIGGTPYAQLASPPSAPTGCWRPGPSP
jgi:ABC-type glutathione transport system ATPase component